MGQRESGICGPAATNTLTPLAESYSGSVPILVIMSFPWFVLAI